MTIPQLPEPDPQISLMLERTDDMMADRLNASNETAIGLLAQHGDWLQGRLNELEGQRDQGSHVPTGFAAYADFFRRFSPPGKITGWARKALRTGK
jgi:hypothetical protein